jgi:hypothetical protein
MKTVPPQIQLAHRRAALAFALRGRGVSFREICFIFTLRGPEQARAMVARGRRLSMLPDTPSKPILRRSFAWSAPRLRAGLASSSQTPRRAPQKTAGK